MKNLKRSYWKLTVLMFFVGAFSSFGQSTWRFDFGDGPVAKGYTKVGANDFYKEEKGYGFELDQVLLSMHRRQVKDPLRADNISSLQPIVFSVKVPEGNYDVEVLLGDADNVSSTVVRAECRRAMTDLIKTKAGEFQKVRFTVHVRDSFLRTNGQVDGAVKLKPREVGYKHWDQLLTLEFNGPAPKVCGVTITPNTKARTVFLAGNSTVVDQDREPWAAWGQMIPQFFQSDSVVIANYAESGEALNSFRSAKRLEKILRLMKPGDYLFIEFGHNDQKQKGEGVGPWTSYTINLKQYVAACKARGGVPVLVTSMHRRNFDSTGAVINTLGDYPAAVRAVAKEEQVALVDLNAMSKDLYEAWGVKESIKAFVHFPANSFPGQDKPLADNTHFSTYGAYHIALCIAKGIHEAKLPLAAFLKPGLPFLYTTQPLHFEDWYWPMSAVKVAVKPDGN